MQSQTRRGLDGLLAIGPHLLDAQLRALAAYAGRAGYALHVLWALLPGEDPSTDAPDSGFPIVVFDDEIAGFTPEERASDAGEDDDWRGAATEWHVAHATAQPKTATSHLPVYGRPGEGETAADAVLRLDVGSLDRQLARIEAYAIRTALRLRGVYVARDADHLQVLLRDFGISRRGAAAGPTLSIGPDGEIRVHP